MFESSVEQTGGRWSINSITISKLLVVNLLTPRPDQTECSDLLTAVSRSLPTTNCVHVYVYNVEIKRNTRLILIGYLLHPDKNRYWVDIYCEVSLEDDELLWVWVVVHVCGRNSNELENNTLRFKRRLFGSKSRAVHLILQTSWHERVINVSLLIIRIYFRYSRYTMLVMTSVLLRSWLRRRREPRSIKMAAYFLQIETRIRYAGGEEVGPD